MVTKKRRIFYGRFSFFCLKSVLLATLISQQSYGAAAVAQPVDVQPRPPAGPAAPPDVHVTPPVVPTQTFPQVNPAELPQIIGATGAIHAKVEANTLKVEHNQPRMGIGFSSFNIANGHGMNINATYGPDAFTLLQVSRAAAPANINGFLNSNAGVLLISPNGIVIGPNGSIDTHSFIASTQDVLNYQQIGSQGYSIEFGKAWNPHARIHNRGGKIKTTGVAAFVSPFFHNEGYVSATAVFAGAGDSVKLTLDGDRGLVDFEVEGKLSQDLLKQKAPVIARGKHVALTPKDAGRIMDKMINLEGEIDASGGQIIAIGGEGAAVNVSGTLSAKNTKGSGGSIAMRAPQITLTENAEVNADGGEGGLVRMEADWLTVAGRVRASGQKGHAGEVTLWGTTLDVAQDTDISVFGAGTHGDGFMRLLGDHMTLRSGTRLNASGNYGGGTIFVGGAKRGRGPDPNAYHLHIEDDVHMFADAYLGGDAGTIVNFSTNQASLYGWGSVGAFGDRGDGGLFELSCLAKDPLTDYFHFGRGKAYIPQRISKGGKAGNFLFDPHLVEIRNYSVGQVEVHNVHGWFYKVILNANDIEDILRDGDHTIEASWRILIYESIYASRDSGHLTLKTGHGHNNDPVFVNIHQTEKSIWTHDNIWMKTGGLSLESELVHYNASKTEIGEGGFHINAGNRAWVTNSIIDSNGDIEMISGNIVDVAAPLKGGEVYLYGKEVNVLGHITSNKYVGATGEERTTGNITMEAHGAGSVANILLGTLTAGTEEKPGTLRFYGFADTRDDGTPGVQIGHINNGHTPVLKGALHFDSVTSVNGELHAYAGSEIHAPLVAGRYYTDASLSIGGKNYIRTVVPGSMDLAAGTYRVHGYMFEAEEAGKEYEANITRYMGLKLYNVENVTWHHKLYGKYLDNLATGGNVTLYTKAKNSELDLRSMNVSNKDHPFYTFDLRTSDGASNITQTKINMPMMAPGRSAELYRHSSGGLASAHNIEVDVSDADIDVAIEFEGKSLSFKGGANMGALVLNQEINSIDYEFKIDGYTMYANGDVDLRHVATRLEGASTLSVVGAHTLQQGYMISDDLTASISFDMSDGIFTWNQGNNDTGAFKKLYVSADDITLENSTGQVSPMNVELRATGAMSIKRPLTPYEGGGSYQFYVTEEDGSFSLANTGQIGSLDYRPETAEFELHERDTVPEFLGHIYAQNEVKLDFKKVIGEVVVGGDLIASSVNVESGNQAKIDFQGLMGDSSLAYGSRGSLKVDGFKKVSIQGGGVYFGDVEEIVASGGITIASPLFIKDGLNLRSEGTGVGEGFITLTGAMKTLGSLELHAYHDVSVSDGSLQAFEGEDLTAYSLVAHSQKGSILLNNYTVDVQDSIDLNADLTVRALFTTDNNMMRAGEFKLTAGGSDTGGIESLIEGVLDVPYVEIEGGDSPVRFTGNMGRASDLNNLLVSNSNKNVKFLGKTLSFKEINIDIDGGIEIKNPDAGASLTAEAVVLKTALNGDVVLDMPAIVSSLEINDSTLNYTGKAHVFKPVTLAEGATDADVLITGGAVVVKGSMKGEKVRDFKLKGNSVQFTGSVEASRDISLHAITGNLFVQGIDGSYIKTTGGSVSLSQDADTGSTLLKTPIDWGTTDAYTLQVSGSLILGAQIGYLNTPTKLTVDAKSIRVEKDLKATEEITLHARDGNLTSDYAFDTADLLKITVDNGDVTLRNFQWAAKEVEAYAPNGHFKVNSGGSTKDTEKVTITDAGQVTIASNVFHVTDAVDITSSGRVSIGSIGSVMRVKDLTINNTTGNSDIDIDTTVEALDSTGKFDLKSGKDILLKRGVGYKLDDAEAAPKSVVLEATENVDISRISASEIDVTADDGITFNDLKAETLTATAKGAGGITLAAGASALDVKTLTWDTTNAAGHMNIRRNILGTGQHRFTSAGNFTLHPGASLGSDASKPALVRVNAKKTDIHGSMISDDLGVVADGALTLSNTGGLFVLNSPTGSFKTTGNNDLTVAGPINFLGNHHLTAEGTGRVEVSGTIGSPDHRSTLMLKGGNVWLADTIYGTKLTVDPDTGSFILTGDTTLNMTSPSSLKASNSIGLTHNLTSTSDLTILATNNLFVQGVITGDKSITMGCATQINLGGKITTEEQFVLNHAAKLLHDLEIEAKQGFSIEAGKIKGNGKSLILKAPRTSFGTFISADPNGGQFDSINEVLEGAFTNLTVHAKALDFSADVNVTGHLSAETTDMLRMDHIHLGGAYNIGSIDLFSGTSLSIDGNGAGQSAAITSHGTLDLQKKRADGRTTTGGIIFNNAQAISEGDMFLGAEVFATGIVDTHVTDFVSNAGNITFDKGVRAGSLGLNIGVNPAANKKVIIGGDFGEEANPLLKDVVVTAKQIDLYADIYATEDVTFEQATVQMMQTANDMQTVSSRNQSVFFNNGAKISGDPVFRIGTRDPINLQTVDDSVSKLASVRGFIIDGVTINRVTPLELVSGDLLIGGGGGNISRLLSTAPIIIHGTIRPKYPDAYAGAGYALEISSAQHLKLLNGVGADAAGRYLKNIEVKTDSVGPILGMVSLKGHFEVIDDFYLNAVQGTLQGDTSLVSQTGTVHMLAGGEINSAAGEHYGLTINAHTGMTVPKLGHTHALGEMTLISDTGDIAMGTGTYVSGDRSYRTNATVTGLQAVDMDGAGTVTFDTAGGVILPAVGGGLPVTFLDAKNVRGRLTLTGDVKAENRVHLPTSLDFGDNRLVQAADIVVEAGAPSLLGPLRLHGNTTFTQNTILQTGGGGLRYIEFGGNVDAQGGLHVKEPVYLKADANFTVGGSARFDQGVDGRSYGGAIKHDFSLTANHLGANLPSVSSVKGLTFSMPGNISVGAIDAESLDVEGVGGSIFLRDSIRTEGNMRFRSPVIIDAAAPVKIQSITGATFFDSSLNWSGTKAPNELTINQVGGVFAAGVGNVRAPSQLTISGMKSIGGTLASQGTIILDSATRLISHTSLRADHLDIRGPIDGRQALVVENRSGFDFSSPIGSMTPLTSFDWVVRSGSPSIQSNIFADSMTFTTPVMPLGPAKLTAQTLSIIPSGVREFYVGGARKPGKYHFGREDLDPAYMDIQNFHMGSRSHPMKVYLSGNFIMPNVHLVVYGNPIIPLVNNIDIAGDGTIVTYVGNIKRAPDYKKVVSGIKASVARLEKSPIERIEDYVAPVEESPLKIVELNQAPVSTEHVNIEDASMEDREEEA